MKSINYYTKGKNYCLYPIITAKSFVKIEHIDRRGGSLYIYIHFPLPYLSKLFFICTPDLDLFFT